MFFITHIIAAIITIALTFFLYYIFYNFKDIRRKKYERRKLEIRAKYISNKVDVKIKAKSYLKYLYDYYEADNVELYYLHYDFNKDKKNKMFKFSLITNYGKPVDKSNKINLELNILNPVFESHLSHKLFPCTVNIFGTNTKMYSNVFKNKEKQFTCIVIVEFDKSKKVTKGFNTFNSIGQELTELTDIYRDFKSF